jgi:hypothetical protein
LTTFINKSLVSIANRPTLSHLIEQFPADVEFVIALGHKGHLVREFLTLAYPERQFFFADVQPFEGPGSGLGRSLLACKPYLNQPFVFLSCDTLVTGAIPAPAENWMAYAEVADLVPYRTLAVDLRQGLVSDICEKGVGSLQTHKAYIGLAGIRDFEQFWGGMESGGELAIATGEAHGLRGLLPDVRAHAFVWCDTGNPAALARARAQYQEADAPNILEKANEAIWFVGQQVIKFSDDQKFISNRVKRVQELQGFVPEINGVQAHMYRYPKVEGKVLSEVVTLPLFERLLAHSTAFWQRKTLTADEGEVFHANCRNFYREKTFERVALFYKNFSRQDGMEPINGVAMPRLAQLLDAVDWEWLAHGLPGRFHGDFHFENILWSASTQKFSFLDWRQDFGGDLSTGDMYYDFAKLLHGLIISHELIARDLYSVEWRSDEIVYDFHRKQVLVECEQYFGKWLAAQGFDVKKVWTLTALIYLNIAALHHNPYSLLLYALGKTMLHNKLDVLNENN